MRCGERREQEGLRATRRASSAVLPTVLLLNVPHASIVVVVHVLHIKTEIIGTDEIEVIYDGICRWIHGCRREYAFGERRRSAGLGRSSGCVAVDSLKRPF